MHINQGSLSFYEQGKQAALAEFGITKEAAMPAVLAKLLRRGAGRVTLPGAGASQRALQEISRAQKGFFGQKVPTNLMARPAMEAGEVAAKAAPVGRAARAVPPPIPAAAKPGASPSPEQLIGSGSNRPVRPPAGDAGSEALRKQMMAQQQAAAVANPEAAGGGGMLSKIPWWGKTLGVGGAAYGAYKMLGNKQPEQQGMQPYYGY